MRSRSAASFVLALIGTAVCAPTHAKDIARVQPAPATVTAPDLGAIGSAVSLLVKNDRLYVGATAGLAMIGPDGTVLSSVPLPAASGRGLDADGDQIAYTGYAIKGLEAGTGLTAALMWGSPSDRLVVDRAEVGLIGADGKLLWSVPVATPTALSPPAFGKDAIAVQSSETADLYSRADGTLASVPMFMNKLGISKNWVSRMPVMRPLWLGDEVFVAHQVYFKRISAKGEQLGYTIELGKRFTTLTSGPLLCKDKILLSEAAYPEGNIFTGKKARVYAANGKLEKIWHADTEEDVTGVGDLVCTDDLIYAVSNSEVVAFTHEGKEAWRFEGKDYALMFGTHRGVLWAGSLPVANKVNSGRQAVIAGPYLYVTGRSGKKFREMPDDILVFDAKTGKRLEQIETNASIIDMAVFGPNLALATTDGLRFVGLKP
jgi:hypothetical protein